MKTRVTRLSLEGNGEYLSRHAGSLVVKSKDGIRKRFPLFENQLQLIQIRSGNAVSSGALVTACCWKIPIVVQTARGRCVGILTSVDSQSHVQTRLDQYKATLSHKGIEIAKAFLLSKLEGQDKVLSKYGQRRFDLVSIRKRIKEADSRNELHSIEGHASDRYFFQIDSLFDETVRPSKRHGFKAFCAVDNLFNLTYFYLKTKVHLALMIAKLEPYLGFLHGIAKGKPALICDFLELYRYICDDHLLTYALKLNLKEKHFVLKKENYSLGKVAVRQYLRDELQKDYWRSLDKLFQSKVRIPRMRRGNSQILSTLINEEALLFAQYLRSEKPVWHPRLVALS